MIPGIVAGYPSGSTPGLNPFSSAISAISPQYWFRMNDAPGSTMANSGSGADGSYQNSAGIDFNQGPLVANESAADSVLFNAAAESASVSISTSSSFVGCVGFCYKGNGAGNTSVRIPWRTTLTFTGGSYFRIDGTSIRIQLSSSAISTGVASSTITDNQPHFILVGRVSDDDTEVHMWIDGSLVWTHALGAGEWVVGSGLVIAKNGGNNDTVYGQFADTFMREGSLSLSQVAAINSAWVPA